MSAPTLHPDFREFLSCLKSHGVRFMIVGAHALAVLGRPRTTNDIDVLVQPSIANATRLATALGTFGFSEYAKQAREHFSKPDRMATLGKEPVRIDILSSISGVTFTEAWRGRVTVSIDGEELHFLGLAEMKKTKRTAGRTKDLLDLELLREIEGPTEMSTRLGSAKRRTKKAVPPKTKRRLRSQ